MPTVVRQSRADGNASRYHDGFVLANPTMEAMSSFMILVVALPDPPLRDVWAEFCIAT